jgi:hypothetical protein
MRNYWFIVIWAEVYMTVCHIVPPSLGKRVSKSHREVVTALERKGSRGCSARRGRWSYET